MNTKRVKCPLCGSWVPTSRITCAMSETDSQARPIAKGAPEVRERGRKAARACWSQEPQAESLLPIFCRWPVAIS
jgi:adenine-specific DNA methylase